jgi:ADP-ribose pyrophosphatase YjhB (NUDIX family)
MKTNKMPPFEHLACPACGQQVKIYKNPFPTVDIIIELKEKGIVLIQRKNPPLGWALPGGFIDYGESAEEAAVREAKEETGLDVELRGLVGVYSDPKRDPRFHTLSVVFKAEAFGEPHACDDAVAIGVFSPKEIPPVMAFDHKKIVEDYFQDISSQLTISRGM